MSDRDGIRDLLRQIDKAIDVLEMVNTMMVAEADMNAAKHMSKRVIPNPPSLTTKTGALASSVSIVTSDLKRTVERYASTISNS